MMMISDLPNDLESEILARVPAKSLSELKTTCKRWYALFKDPKFVEKNKKMSSEAARETILLSNHECEMYELISDSWRVDDSFTLDYGMYCSGVSLRGDTYFVACDKDSGFFLMKFDFTEERFVRLPLPFQSFDPEDTAVLTVVRDEKLSVCHQDILAWSNVMRIWVTHKVDEEGGKEISWRKTLSWKWISTSFNSRVW
ncbi:hypothetical protein F2Q70_00013815 [Brassica cretica]|uniref:F-box domain-containing protein n=1 Tax=Brassica cretica TaxID=69181 RepID=A0A8S9M103_BRACR|nr:hypothetical protein F2Q68_00006856 [Brassica cretica]KAF2611106.1 hypothetical protein F2Q70_00013815 [Brassica cretica]